MHDEIMSYGPVSKIHGLLGVGAFPVYSKLSASYSWTSQDKMLFVYDPKALHHMVVKEQYTYEETPIFLK